MKKYLPYFFLSLPFLLLKITNLGIWLSDTNIYFYTGFQLLQGKILYKDIFFTNFPLLPYVSAVYFLLTGGRIPLFFFTATIEVLITGFLIYLIVYKQSKTILVATVSSALYIYSFIVLATSDHQTGVFLASLLAVLSYFFSQRKRFFLTGIFIALALLTKAYFLPLFLALLLVIFLRDRKSIFAFLAGFAGAIFVVLLPSLLLAPSDLFRDVISYSLTRSQGIEKTNIIRFFVSHDFLLALLLVWNILMIRKQIFFGLVSIFAIAFVLLYQDIYYLYLNFAIPFLCLNFPSLYQTLQNKFHIQKMVIPTLIFIPLLINLYTYVASYRSLQRIENIHSVAELILKEKPKSLYGINSITPALAYLTNTPLLAGIIDTNENIFRKGFLDKTKLTKRAISEHAVIVANGASYPQYNVDDQIMGGIFDEELVKTHCTPLSSTPIRTEGVENRINLFRC